MLSEALCSRARKVSEAKSGKSKSKVGCEAKQEGAGLEDEVPFARRAREEGRQFRGGKTDGKSFSSVLLEKPGMLTTRQQTSQC